MKVGHTAPPSGGEPGNGCTGMGEEDVLACGKERVGGPSIWLGKLGWRRRRRVFGSVRSSAKENKGVFPSNWRLYTYKQKQASSLVCTVASRVLPAYRGVKMKITVVDIHCKMRWEQGWWEGESCVLLLSERYCDQQKWSCQGFLVKNLTYGFFCSASNCVNNVSFSPVE